MLVEQQGNRGSAKDHSGQCLRLNKNIGCLANVPLYVITSVSCLLSSFCL